MPLTKALMVGSLILLPTAVFAQFTQVFGNDTWQVYFEPDYTPLQAACTISTSKATGRIQLNAFQDHLAGIYVRNSQYLMEEDPKAQILLQVDDHPSWTVPAERGLEIVQMDQLDTTLLGQMAVGQLLKIDVNADGQWDDKFELGEVYPAMQALANCIGQL